MKKIAIVGYGYVGKATELMFDNVEILIHDPDLGHTIDDWDGVDYAFICVPTPMDKSGRLDFSYVDSVCSLLAMVRLLSEAQLLETR